MQAYVGKEILFGHLPRNYLKILVNKIFFCLPIHTMQHQLARVD